MIVSLQNAIRTFILFHLCRVLSLKSLSMFHDITSRSKTIAIDRQSSPNLRVILLHSRRNIASNVEHHRLPCFVNVVSFPGWLEPVFNPQRSLPLFIPRHLLCTKSFHISHYVRSVPNCAPLPQLSFASPCHRR